MQYKTLDSLCKVASGGTPSRSKKEYWDGGDIPWIKIGNIKSKVVSNADEYITEAGLNNSSAKLFKKGTILYTIFATLGEVGILDFDACTNQAIAGISIEKPEEIITDYLYYYLKSKKAEVNQIGRGVAQNNINLSILRKFSIPLRDIEDQKTIVGSLNKVESIIEKQKQQLERLDELIKARFVEMFDGDYEEVELSELGKISTGSTPPMKNKDFYENADMPFYKPGDFIDGVSNIDCSESFVDARAESVSRIMDPGTVAVTCIGIIGKIGIIKRRGICNQQINFIAPNDNVNSIYLAYAIDTKKKFMQEKANAPVVPILNKTNFSKVTIPFAPVELQNQFAAFVAQVDKSKFALGDELAMGNFYIRLIYDRIMHGRIDLRVA